MTAVYVPSSLADIGSGDSAGRILEKNYRFPGIAPSGVSGLIGDWDAFALADLGTAPGAAISTWTGSVGGAVVQATGINQPTYYPTCMGGFPGVVFDPQSHSQYLTNASFTLPDQGAYTTYLVCEPLNHGGKALDLFGFGGTANRSFLSLDTAKPFYFLGAGGSLAPNVGWRGPGPVVCSTVIDRANNAFRFGTDGIEVSTTGTSVETAVALTGINIGCRYPTGANTTFGARMTLGRLLIFNGAHNAATVAGITTWLSALYRIQGFPSQATPRLILDGSSITMGGQASTGAKAAWGLLRKFWPLQGWEFRAVGYGGATTAGLNGAVATRVAPYLSDHAECLILYDEGANDENTGGLYTQPLAYATTAGGFGAKVILSTALYRQGDTAAVTDAYNAGLRTNWQGNSAVVQLADPNLDYLIGQPTASTGDAVTNVAGNLTYFADGVHLTDAGHVRLFRAWMQAILAYLRPPGLPIPVSGTTQTFFGSFASVVLRTFPVATTTEYLVRFDGSARRIDSGSEYAEFSGYAWRVSVAAGTVTITAIASNAATYSAVGMSTANVTLAIGGQGFAVTATGEAGKAICFAGDVRLEEAA